MIVRWRDSTPARLCKTYEILLWKKLTVFGCTRRDGDGLMSYDIDET